MGRWKVEALPDSCRPVDVVCTPMNDAFQVHQHPPTKEYSHDPLVQPELQGRNRRGGGAWVSLQGPARYWASVVLLMSLKDHGHRILNNKRWSWGRPTEEGLRGSRLNCALQLRRKLSGKPCSSVRNYTSKCRQHCYLMVREKRSLLCWNTQKRCSIAVT